MLNVVSQCYRILPCMIHESGAPESIILQCHLRTLGDKEAPLEVRVLKDSVYLSTKQGSAQNHRSRRAAESTWRERGRERRRGRERESKGGKREGKITCIIVSLHHSDLLTLAAHTRELR